MKKNNREIGSVGETIACDYLERKGYQILKRNFRCKLGEIDIIAFSNGYIVFVEVKYRENNKCGYPREAVNYYKQKNITRVASYYLMIDGSYNTNCRFDVVEIMGNKIKHIPNAFNATY